MANVVIVGVAGLVDAFVNLFAVDILSSLFDELLVFKFLNKSQGILLPDVTKVWKHSEQAEMTVNSTYKIPDLVGQFVLGNVVESKDFVW